MIIRLGLFLAGTLALSLAMAYLVDISAVAWLWPWPVYGLSTVFVASILAAIGAPLIWLAFSGERAAIKGGAANLFVSNAGMAFYALVVVPEASGSVLLFGYTTAVIALIQLGLVFWSSIFAFEDKRPTPRLVLVSFALFFAALLVTGAMLILEIDGTFPWVLGRDNSVLYGLIFLGNAVYFAYGIFRPVWGNAKGQLLAFLAYDFVLIGPYVDKISSIDPRYFVSLVIFIAVLIYSGVLAIWFLFVNNNTRLGSRISIDGNLTAT